MSRRRDYPSFEDDLFSSETFKYAFQAFGIVVGVLALIGLGVLIF
jgi:hypothetical protein